MLIIKMFLRPCGYEVDEYGIGRVEICDTGSRYEACGVCGANHIMYDYNAEIYNGSNVLTHTSNAKSHTPEPNVFELMQNVITNMKPITKEPTNE